MELKFDSQAPTLEHPIGSFSFQLGASKRDLPDTQGCKLPRHILNIVSGRVLGGLLAPDLPSQLEPENGALNHCSLFFFKIYSPGDSNVL